MSRWAVVMAGVVAVGFFSLPLLLGRASRSGRMALWDTRIGAGTLSDRQQRIAWRVRLGLRLFMTAVCLWALLLSLVQHQPITALLFAAFFAFQVWLLVIMVRLRPRSWSSGPPAADGRRPPSDRP